MSVMLLRLLHHLKLLFSSFSLVCLWETRNLLFWCLINICLLFDLVVSIGSLSLKNLSVYHFYPPFSITFQEDWIALSFYIQQMRCIINPIGGFSSIIIVHGLCIVHVLTYHIFGDHRLMMISWKHLQNGTRCTHFLIGLFFKSFCLAFLSCTLLLPVCYIRLLQRTI